MKTGRIISAGTEQNRSFKTSITVYPIFALKKKKKKQFSKIIHWFCFAPPKIRNIPADFEETGGARGKFTYSEPAEDAQMHRKA